MPICQLRVRIRIIKDDLLITSDSKIFQQVVLKILLKKKVFLRFSVLTSNVSDILCLLAGTDITSFYGFDLELFRQSGILCFSCYSNFTLQWLTSFWSGLTIKSILNDIGFSYIWNIQQNVDLMSIKICLAVHPKIALWYT